MPALKVTIPDINTFPDQMCRWVGAGQNSAPAGDVRMVRACSDGQSDWRRHHLRCPGPRQLAALGLVATLAACASTASGDDANDPFEPMNRAIFKFNDVADRAVIGPVARTYGRVVPETGRTGIRNFLDNLSAPVIFANDLFQAEGDRAGVTLGRFMINTLLGVGGLFDMASQFHYAKHSEDFGQTLGHYGTGEGPYLMLPILGPSNPRDLLGLLVDSFVLDPVAYVAPLDARIGRAVVNGVDTRERLDPVISDLRANSIDPYATLRTVYRQRRDAEIRNGAAASNQAYEDIFNEPDPSVAPTN
jgi:phospholipid-binding lipoprotein MlaA